MSAPMTRRILRRSRLSLVAKSGSQTGCGRSSERDKTRKPPHKGLLRKGRREAVFVVEEWTLPAGVVAGRRDWARSGGECRPVELEEVVSGGDQPPLGTAGD